MKQLAMGLFLSLVLGEPNGFAQTRNSSSPAPEGRQAGCRGNLPQLQMYFATFSKGTFHQTSFRTGKQKLVARYCSKNRPNNTSRMLFTRASSKRTY
jgi:hypothetical protein